jgi:polyhydroxybutyrate depolymerase
MKSRSLASIVAFVLLISLPAVGSTRLSGLDVLPPSFERLSFKVDGIDREALLYVPPMAKSNSTPVVFVFHGHGGTAGHAARSFALHRYWPEAIVVYMQGVNTPGRLTDPEGKQPGWQARIGEQGDRDLRFFDVVLARLRRDFKVDEERIYSTGHSNGGAFTYLLWAARGESLAAVAPSGAAVGVRTLSLLRPKPAMHLAGENDPLVKFEWQRSTMNAVSKINGCTATGKPWDEHCTAYESRTGTPLVRFIHSEGHRFPDTGPKMIVKFFKAHPGQAH